MENSWRMEDLRAFLDELATDGKTLCLMKANDGYSAVILPPNVYHHIIGLEHYNEKTLGEAIYSAAHEAHSAPSAP